MSRCSSQIALYGEQQQFCDKMHWFYYKTVMVAAHMCMDNSDFYSIAWCNVLVSSVFSNVLSCGTGVEQQCFCEIAMR